jgi:hypothetical protein
MGKGWLICARLSPVASVGVGVEVEFSRNTLMQNAF